MIDSTVKPRCIVPRVEHCDDLHCECIVAVVRCPEHDTITFWHNDFDVARVRKVEAGHP